MRRWAVRRACLFVFGLVSLIGCGGLPGARGRCDQAALRAAADATDAMLASWQPQAGALPDYRVAVRGLESACPALPRGFHGFLTYAVHPVPDVRSSEMSLGTPMWEDDEAMRPLRAHCPAYARLLAESDRAPADRRPVIFYDGCDFAGLGVATREEIGGSLGDLGGLGSHALYLWLVDDGAPPEVARALARPILMGTDMALGISVQLPQLPTSPQGAAVSWFVPTLVVDDRRVDFDHKTLVHLDRGRLVEADVAGAKVDALHDALAEEIDRSRALAQATDRPPEPLPLAIAADPGLRWATVGKLAWTAMLAGHDTLEVRAVAPDPLHPLVNVPLVSRGPAPTGEIVIGASELVVRCEAEGRASEAAAFAREVVKCGARPMRLAVVDDVTWQRVVEVLGELAGKATITGLVRPGAARLDSEDPAYVAVEPNGVVRIAGGRAYEMRVLDDGTVWRLGFSPHGVAYGLGFDRVYRIDDDGLTRVTRDAPPTNGGALVGFAPISDREIWAFDEVTVVRWDGERWHDLSPGPVAALAGDFDVRRQMNDLYVDREGRVWASALRSLRIRVGDAWRGLDPAPDLKRGQIDEIVADGAGGVHLHLSDHSFLRVVPGATPGERDRITSVAPLPGVTWQDDAQVTIVDADDRRRSYVAGRDFPGRNQGYFTSDASGRLWALTTEGLAVLGPGDERTVWPVGTLPALSGAPRDILVYARGPQTLPPVGPVRTGGLRGAVYLRGQPLPRAAVEVCPHPLMIQPRPCEGSEPTLATTTTADGSLELTGVPLGAFGLTVQTPDGWKLAFHASDTLGKQRMREGELLGLGTIYVTGGMVAQTLPWHGKPKPTK